MVVDYSKWDNFTDEDDDETPPGNITIGSTFLGGSGCRDNQLDDLPAESAWKPALAARIEASILQPEDEEISKSWSKLPWLTGFEPAPACAMWVVTKPNEGGGELVKLLDVDGIANDSNMWRGMIVGVLDFRAETPPGGGMSYVPQHPTHPVLDRPSATIDESALVAQHIVEPPTDCGFLGGQHCRYRDGLMLRGSWPFVIAGKVLRSSGDAAAVLRSLGFKRNPAAAAGDEDEWCRVLQVDQTDGNLANCVACNEAHS